MMQIIHNTIVYCPMDILYYTRNTRTILFYLNFRKTYFVNNHFILNSIRNGFTATPYIVFILFPNEYFSISDYNVYTDQMAQRHIINNFDNNIFNHLPILTL